MAAMPVGPVPSIALDKQNYYIPYIVIPPIYGDFDPKDSLFTYCAYPQTITLPEQSPSVHFIYSGQPWYIPWVRYAVNPQSGAPMATYGAAFGPAEIAVILLLIYIVYRLVK